MSGPFAAAIPKSKRLLSGPNREEEPVLIRAFGMTVGCLPHTRFCGQSPFRRRIKRAQSHATLARCIVNFASRCG